jgi:hypothetical protein
MFSGLFCHNRRAPLSVPSPAAISSLGADRRTWCPRRIQVRRAEGFHDDVEVAVKIPGLPLLPSRFGDQAGESVEHIRKPRQPLEVFSPGSNLTFANGWLGDVIQHEGLVGKPGNEFDGHGQVLWE